MLWPQGLARNFVVNNQTTGAFTVTIAANNGMGAAAGTTFVVPPISAPFALASDGTNVAAWFGGFLPISGGTLSNPTTTILALNATNVSNRSIRFQTNLLNRWIVLANNNAETGSNAGSNFQIQNFNDAGTQISNVLTINRATGITALTQTPTFPTVSTGDNSTNGATTAYVINEVTAFTSANYLPLTGGTIAGNLTVGNGLGATVFRVDGAAGTNRNVEFTSTGSLRWNILANNTAESGSNAGSDLNISRFNDAGTLLGQALTIKRSTGIVTVGVSPAAGDNSTNVATTAFVQASAPFSSATNTNVSGNGSLRLIGRINILSPNGGNYIVAAMFSQGFGSGSTAWAAEILLNGSTSFCSLLNSQSQQSVALMANIPVTASGSNQTIDLMWSAANTATLGFGTITAQLTN